MGRILGIDPGAKRVGVAVSNTACTMALARESLRVNDAIFDAIRELVDELRAETVVVGRPVGLSGAATDSTRVADQFREELARAVLDVNVVAVDERLSTVSAARKLKAAGVTSRSQRELIDSAAAVELLQGYLDGLVR